jgi:hypothetical protein
MFYIDHSTDGPYDPAAAPLFGAIAGYEIPAHPPTASWDTTDTSWNNFSIPPENASTDCYCGTWPVTPHPAGREVHAQMWMDSPYTQYAPQTYREWLADHPNTNQEAYDRYAAGLNVVPQ